LTFKLEIVALIQVCEYHLYREKYK
jgi:hypothetical protein